MQVLNTVFYEPRTRCVHACAGIFPPQAQITIKKQQGAIELQPGSQNFVTQHNRVLTVPNWMADGYLVFIDAKYGGEAPAGDLRFVLDTAGGVRQLVIIQCKEIASNETVCVSNVTNVFVYTGLQAFMS